MGSPRFETMISDFRGSVEDDVASHVRGDTTYPAGHHDRRVLGERSDLAIEVVKVETGRQPRLRAASCRGGGLGLKVLSARGSAASYRNRLVRGVAGSEVRSWPGATTVKQAKVPSGAIHQREGRFQ